LDAARLSALRREGKGKPSVNERAVPLPKLLYVEAKSQCADVADTQYRQGHAPKRRAISGAGQAVFKRPEARWACHEQGEPRV